MSREVLMGSMVVFWCLMTCIALGLYWKERMKRKILEAKLEEEQEISQELILERTKILQELEDVRADKFWLKTAN